MYTYSSTFHVNHYSSSIKLRILKIQTMEIRGSDNKQSMKGKSFKRKTNIAVMICKPLFLSLFVFSLFLLLSISLSCLHCKEQRSQCCYICITNEEKNLVGVRTHIEICMLIIIMVSHDLIIIIIIVLPTVLLRN